VPSGRIGAPDRKAAAFLVGAAALLVLGIHWGSFFGHFLSDDFGFPWGLYHAAARGDVWGYVWDHVVITEPQPGNFYRPIGFATFALDWLAFGADPLGWRLTNFALHLLNGWLVWRLARRMAEAQPQARFAAALAGALFLAYPLAPEVSAWMVARFDALALAGILIALERHLAARAVFDGARIASLAAFAFALGSKEPAMTTPAFLVLGGFFLVHAREPLLRRAALTLRDVVPALAVLAAYLAWRHHLFAGSTVEVYAGSSPLAHLSPVALWRHLVGMRPIPDAAFGGAWPWAVLALAALGAWNAIHTWRRGAFATLWLLPFLGLAVSVGAVLPHFAGVPANGEGARLFYLAGAWLALWLALPLACREAPRMRLGVAWVLVVLFAAGQAQAMVPWRKAGQAMNALMTAIDDAVAHGDPRVHALVVVPDHWRSAPFLRNAQGAPVIPPFRREAVSARVSLFTPVAYAEWAGRIARGDVPWTPAQPVVPQLSCFDADTARFVAVDVPTTPAALADWAGAWQAALAGSACADEFAG
jgi:hypothetical protein